MTARWFDRQLVMVGAALALGATATLGTAEARTHSSSHGHHGATAARTYNGHARYVFHFRRHWGGGLQCVPFARENTGIELSGNANTWWDQAEGIYQRGAKPEVGSVLNFRSTGRMRMGHVAVVTNVLDARRIQIDQANWGGPGRITRDVEVVDVSPANDWTAVRVALGEGESYGSVYPTYGFIYDRPDHGTMVANNTTAPAPVLNPAPADLRPEAERVETAVAATEPEEVAEAEDDPAPHASRHHSYHHGRFHVASGHAHAFRAGVYRVSSHGIPVAHPHDPPPPLLQSRHNPLPLGEGLRESGPANLDPSCSSQAIEWED